MRKILITLSNDLYKESRIRLGKSAADNGIEEVLLYDFEDIKSHDFYRQNRHILDNKKYMGYWLWKPFFILKTLEELSDGDVLVYADAGTEIIQSIDPLIDICLALEPILLFGNASDTNASWTKRDCFVMMDCDEPNFWFGPHCDAALSLYRKCERSIEFVKEWIRYGCNENILTDAANICGLPNLNEYKDHRYDQSILSLLAQKFEISLYRMPTQFGNHYKMYQFRIISEFNCVNQANQTSVNYYHNIPYYNSPYGQLLNHHRTQSKLIASISIINENPDAHYPTPKSFSTYVSNGIKTLMKKLVLK